MTAARRWWCVGIGVLLLVAAPVLAGALPASDADVTAVALLRRIESSRAVPFSGYVETSGSVALPDSEELSGLGDLLGGDNRIRAWWRDPTVWRISTLRTTGETDLVRAGDRLVEWVYESKDVTVMPDVSVRLPNTSDLMPNVLARRVLEGARSEEIRRLPARRVAGVDALGLRLRPADRQASIGRVDVYADPRSGLPVSVTMFARGVSWPSLRSEMVDLDIGRPPESALGFTPPPDAVARTDSVVDLADAANRYSARVPPATLAGLPARGPGKGGPVGSVGVYGRGPTVLLAIPLWHRSAYRVRADLLTSPGVRELDEGLLVSAPPMQLLLADPEPNESSWLLAGTVTGRALAEAARELAAHRPGLRLP